MGDFERSDLTMTPAILRRDWLGIAALLPLAACGEPPAQDCRPDASAVQEIRAVASGIIAADNASDIERVLSYYSTDAILMPPGEAPVAGRNNIRPRYEGLFADFTPEIEGHIDEACAGSGFGFVRGHNGGRLVPHGDGTARVLDDGYIILLRREEDGTWRISHLIWHRQSGN